MDTLSTRATCLQAILIATMRRTFSHPDQALQLRVKTEARGGRAAGDRLWARAR